LTGRRPTPKKRGYHHGDLKNARIEAGMNILSEEGVGGLTLRKVAHRAGVSYAAPYAHFADKQALIAAISTDGYQRLYDQLSRAVHRHDGDPRAQLVEGAWAYVTFALEDTAHFRVTMSGVVEKEKDYPAFVAVSQKSFALVLEIVEACQRDGILRPGPTDIVALGVWSLLHGFVSLLLENQVSHAVRDRFSIRDMLVAVLEQITCVPVATGW
jgi:AcrR family transcriptional regulator